jgi:chromosome segregation ATPase
MFPTRPTIQEQIQQAQQTIADLDADLDAGQKQKTYAQAELKAAIKEARDERRRIELNAKLARTRKKIAFYRAAIKRRDDKAFAEQLRKAGVSDEYSLDALIEDAKRGGWVSPAEAAAADVESEHAGCEKVEDFFGSTESTVQH